MNAKPRPVRAEERRYFKEVRFRQIRALFEISRHVSFAAAARALGMATPSVWRQVRALEDDYGVRFVAAKEMIGIRFCPVSAARARGIVAGRAKVFKCLHGIG
jgi:hypothetical protein